MAETSDLQDAASAAESMWYLQKRDGSEYGPENMDTMARWAAESRIVSGNKLSRDRKEWIPVEEIPELAMDWLAELPDGRKYGPFNIEATGDLVGHKVLPQEAILRNRKTSESITVAAYLDPTATNEEDGRQPVPPSPDVPTGTDSVEDRPSTTSTEHVEDSPAPRRRTARKAVNRKKNAEDVQDLFSGLTKLGSSEEASTSPEGVEESPSSEAHVGQPLASEDVRGQMDAIQDADADLVKMDPENGPGPAETTTEETAPDEQDTRMEPTQPSVQAERDEEAPVDTGSAERQVLLTQIEDLTKRLAEADRERRTALRQVNEAKSLLTKIEAERDGARKIAVSQESQFKEKMSSLQMELDKEREARAAEQLGREDQTRELSETAEELEQRLEAAMNELKKARNGEVKAAETLKNVESQLARKTAIQDKRVQDLVSERNTLAQLVESETSQVKRLRMSLIALGVVAAVLAIITLQRGCSKTQSTDGSQPPDAELAAALPPTQPGPPQAAQKPAGQAGTTRRVSIPVIKASRGARVAYSRDGSTVVFDEGVFTTGASISPDAQRILKELAPQIRPFLSEYELVVEGHTDNQRVRGTGAYKNNAELSLERARAVARFLAEQGGIPLTAMRAVSAGDSNPPYPNDTSASRARNRTVVLKLVRHAGN